MNGKYLRISKKYTETEQNPERRDLAQTRQDRRRPGWTNFSRSEV
jgi:hypothetical protein